MGKKDKGKAAIGIASFTKASKFLMKKKGIKCRFKLPFSLECKGCRSSVAMGVEVNVIKELKGKHDTGKFWRYNIKCPFCRHQIVMRTDGGLEYNVIKGAAKMEDKQKSAGGLDWDAWKKKRNKAYFDGLGVDPSERYNFFDAFHFAVVVGDPRGDGPLYAV